jgi:hypothetical protein
MGAPQGVKLTHGLPSAAGRYVGQAHLMWGIGFYDLMHPLERDPEVLGALAQRMAVDIVRHELQSAFSPHMVSAPSVGEVAKHGDSRRRAQNWFGWRHYAPRTSRLRRRCIP